jgi:hypothetical protein
MCAWRSFSRHTGSSLNGHEEPLKHCCAKGGNLRGASHWSPGWKQATELL